MHWIRLARWLPTLVLALACRAGGEIATVPEWTLSADPTLVIGEDGTTAGEFERVSTALALPGDEVAVVDAGASEIRVFSGSGAYLRTLGRRGEGPGEFNGISWVQLVDDTLVAYSSGQRRITMLALDGSMHATIIPRPAGEGVSASPLTRAGNGSWVVRAGRLRLAQQVAVQPEGAAPPSGVTRDTTGVGFLPVSGEGPVNFVVKIPGQPMVGVPGGPVGVGAFSAPLAVARVGDRVAVVDLESGALWWFSAGGTEESRADIAVPRRPLPLAAVDSIRRAAMERSQSPREQAMMELMFSSEAAPPQYPMFRSLLADGTDQLWLEEWQLELPPSARYQIVGVDGSWRATVSMPIGFTPTAIGPDWVLGVHRDEDGLQRVMRYALTRQ